MVPRIKLMFWDSLLPFHLPAPVSLASLDTCRQYGTASVLRASGNFLSMDRRSPSLKLLGIYLVLFNS